MAGAITSGRQAIRMFAEHEHDELGAGIERIHELGEELATLPVDQRAASIRKVLHWIDADVKPHMAWEESWLFPQIDARAGTPWATRLVRFDHQQIAAQAERLHAHGAYGSRVPPHDTVTLVADLSGLEALLRANVEREERFLLPLLESEADRWAPEWPA
jgi:hemerythrin HHE cation binding domain-containing protein